MTTGATTEIVAMKAFELSVAQANGLLTLLRLRWLDAWLYRLRSFGDEDYRLATGCLGTLMR